MAQLNDVNIVIEVNKPSPLTGLGTPLILVNYTSPIYNEFSSKETIREVFGDASDAYKIAAQIEAQGQYRPDKIAVATYQREGSGSITPPARLEQIFDRDWYFCLTDTLSPAERLSVSQLVDGRDIKTVSHNISAVAELQPFELTPLKRTMFFGSDADKLSQYLAAGAVGAVGSRVVGSTTWKFKSITNVTPMVDVAKALGFMTKNVNVYVNASGRNNLRDGVMHNGEFIDVIHSIDWVKINGEQAIESVLLNNDKVPYTDDGIALFVTALQDTLEQAGRQGIIATKEDGTYNYSIRARSRAETTAAERASRTYTGLNFEFYLAGAIHRVDPIRGVVNF